MNIIDDKERLPEDMRGNLIRMKDYLLSRGPSLSPPIDLIDELRHILDYLILNAIKSGDRVASDYYAYVMQHLSRKISNAKAVGFIDSILAPSSVPFGVSLRTSSESRLEQKIRRIEEEMNRLSSNPSINDKLDDKLSRLEKELLEIRTLEDKLSKSSVAELDAKVKKLEKEVQVYSNGVESEELSIEDRLNAYINAEKRVFVIMPFAHAFDDPWRGGIERACKSKNYYCLRVDEINLSSGITDDIKKCVDIADVVIADVTGSNPNVMFELGWALAKGKEPIVIRQSDDPIKVAFDIQEYRYLPYLNSWSGVERLRTDLCKYIGAADKILMKKKQTELKNVSTTEKTDDGN
jgi:hypothetical protein